MHTPIHSKSVYAMKNNILKKKEKKTVIFIEL